MQIRVGYEIVYDCVQPTPMVLMLNVHHSRVADIVVPDHLMTDPALPVHAYRDAFGNWCSRIVAPKGRTRITSTGVVRDNGLPDPYVPAAVQHPVQDLPDETLTFLLGSRYCETDHLSEVAWRLFGHGPEGWGRVQAICDFVHNHIRFDYMSARSTKTAWDVFNEKVGVCRDFAHLAVAFCRCMNIPARYCTGYLSDINVPPPHGPMDFAGWFEAYLGGAWHTFDPRNNKPLWGRILIGRGRDAVDVPISNAFGPNTLVGFTVLSSSAARRRASRRIRRAENVSGSVSSVIRGPLGTARRHGRTVTAAGIRLFRQYAISGEDVASPGPVLSRWSPTIASVVIISAPTDAACCRADRTTLVGSMIPAFTMSLNSPLWASKPQW
jgi:transglutaminase-like putative cysteine protease